MLILSNNPSVQGNICSGLLVQTLISPQCSIYMAKNKHLSFHWFYSSLPSLPWKFQLMGRKTFDENEGRWRNRPIYVSQAASIVFSSFIYRAAWKQQDKKARGCKAADVHLCHHICMSRVHHTLCMYISIHKILVSVHFCISEKVIFYAGLWNTWLTVWNTHTVLFTRTEELSKLTC